MSTGNLYGVKTEFAPETGGRVVIGRTRLNFPTSDAVASARGKTQAEANKKLVALLRAMASELLGEADKLEAGR